MTNASDVLSSSSSFPQSSAQPNLATRQPPEGGRVTSLLSFRSLQHIQNRRSTSHGLYLPTTFRLQGLASLLTAFSLLSLADCVSNQQRSWDYPFGAFPFRKVSEVLPPRWAHIPFRSPLFPSTNALGRPEEYRFLGFNPSGSPFRNRTGLEHDPTATPLGFALLGCTNKSLEQDFASSPLTPFRRTSMRTRQHAAGPQSIIDSCLAPA